MELIQIFLLAIYKTLKNVQNDGNLKHANELTSENTPVINRAIFRLRAALVTRDTCAGFSH